MCVGRATNDVRRDNARGVNLRCLSCMCHGMVLQVDRFAHIVNPSIRSEARARTVDTPHRAYKVDPRCTGEVRSPASRSETRSPRPRLCHEGRESSSSRSRSHEPLPRYACKDDSQSGVYVVSCTDLPRDHRVTLRAHCRRSPISSRSSQRNCRYLTLASSTLG